MENGIGEPYSKDLNSAFDRYDITQLIKRLVKETPNDMELGKKVRDLIFDKPTPLTDLKSEETNIFGKVKGGKYRELIDGYQGKKGVEFTKWYEELTKEEKVFLSDMFD